MLDSTPFYYCCQLGDLPLCSLSMTSHPGDKHNLKGDHMSSETTSTLTPPPELNQETIMKETDQTSKKKPNGSTSRGKSLVKKFVDLISDIILPIRVLLNLSATLLPPLLLQEPCYIRAL